MTLSQMLRGTVARHGTRTAFVTIGKAATSWTYSEVFERVRGYAGALQAHGVQRGEKIAIISDNCPEWALLDWACQCLGAIVVPAYPTAPADQLEYIVRDSGARLLVVGTNELRKKVANIPGTETILLTGDQSLDSEASSAAMDRADFDAAINEGDEESICTIIYTSGTTGTPKGAMMPHRAFVHVCKSAKNHIQVDENDRFLEFLPMSHVYERVAGQCLPVFLGATICFSRSLMALANEMVEFKPTVMLCVPRFLENFRSRVLDSVAKDKPFKRQLFKGTLAQGIIKAKGGFAPFFPILNSLVGAKLRARTGGSMRYFVSGGAALTPEVAEFYMAFGLVVLQGYGLTETSGGSVVNKPENNKYWTVGEPLDMEVKIAEDGEILFRGRGLMLGYYNLPDDTAAAIDTDGWFHTGDIGEFEGKNLKITDRKKDILVLANGKNVAPQKIENALRYSAFIQEAVVFGDGKDYCVAIILPKAEAVRRQLGLGDDVVLSNDDQVKALIKKEVDKVNKTLAPYEMVKRHALLDREFSVDAGEITPTLKVKRKVVQKKFADLIESISR